MPSLSVLGRRILAPLALRGLSPLALLRLAPLSLLRLLRLLILLRPLIRILLGLLLRPLIGTLLRLLVLTPLALRRLWLRILTLVLRSSAAPVSDRAGSVTCWLSSVQLSAAITAENGAVRKLRAAPVTNHHDGFLL